MTPQDKALELREAVVASDPTTHSALVGHVGASQFLIGDPAGPCISNSLRPGASTTR